MALTRNVIDRSDSLILHNLFPRVSYLKAHARFHFGVLKKPLNLSPQSLLRAESNYNKKGAIGLIEYKGYLVIDLRLN